MNFDGLWSINCKEYLQMRMHSVRGPLDGGLDELLAPLPELLQDLAPLGHGVQQGDFPLHAPDVDLLIIYCRNV